MIRGLGWGLMVIAASAAAGRAQTPASASAAATPAVDTFDTSAGQLKITFFGHATLMLEWDGKVIHVDPVRSYADVARLPKADLILITHAHGDHLDGEAVAALRTPRTLVVVSRDAAAAVPGARRMVNGDRLTTMGLTIEAVPAYNIVNMRGGRPYHPKGEGNGYVLTLADRKIYIAGDTENTPEMKALEHIDIAFLPMNLPFTMTPEMVADAARAFKPKVLYPYHYGQTDPQRLVELLRDAVGIEVRVRKME